MMLHRKLGLPPGLLSIIYNMGFCSCTSKLVIVVINLFFWLGTALLIYAGVSYLTGASDVLQHVSRKPAYITFGIASLLFLCGLIGIAGAFSEKKFLLGIFSVVVLIVLALLVFVSATLFVKHDTYMNETDTFFLNQFNNYGNQNHTVDTKPVETTTASGSGSGNHTTPSPHTNVTTTIVTTTAAPTPDKYATDVIDSVQENFHCCGFTNYTDWNTYDYWTNTLSNKGSVPSSCCNDTAAKATNQTCPAIKLNIKTDKALIYTDPCEKEIHTVVNFALKFMSWAAVAFIILVSLGFCASMYLMCRKRSSDGFNYSSIVA